MSPSPSPRKLVLFCAAWTLLFPSLVKGQVLAREALRSFPADTHQLAYTNLSDLRNLSNFPQIRQRLLTPQLSAFEEFLRSMGTDPEKDVDEVVMGWRGPVADTTKFFGLASGRFQPEKAHEFFTRSELPVRQHAGQELFAFGSGVDPADLFFVFLDSTLAAFGRLEDLKALLDVRSGSRLALDSNSQFVNWEAEVEGTGPQWGLMTGKGAANLAAPWLMGGAKTPVNPGAFMGAVQAVLYRVEWSSGFTARLSLLCQNAESADALAKLLTFWRDSQRAGTRPSVPASLTDLDVRSGGARVEVTASGPVEALDPILRGTTSVSGP